ncbi:MAG: ATP synthase F1 subunit epsilon [Eubacteriales bacterium]|nr:ATP synthase F1 subunit epsilon [Eubacteriales bacterium]
MATFHLKVLTTERCFFDDEVEQIVVRTTQGDAGILPNHIPYTAALGIGGLTIIQNGAERVAAIAGGFVDVSKEQTVVLARTCEWADEIDINRAREAAERARQKLQQKASEHEQDVAQVKLKKAVNRMRIAGEK